MRIVWGKKLIVKLLTIVITRLTERVKKKMFSYYNIYSLLANIIYIYLYITI